MTSSGPDPRLVVRHGYEVLRERYGQWTSSNDPPYRLHYLRRLTDRIGPRSRVLELGCGPGVPVAAELARDHLYIGVDASIAQLNLARDNAPSGHFVWADMTRVAFTPSSFDGIVAFYSIIHVPREDHVRLLADIGRWLRPGGCLVANMGVRDDPGSYDDWIDGVRMFWSGFDADTNLQMLRASGLRVERSEILTNFEDGREVRFLWVEAVRSPDAAAAQ